MTTKDLYRKAWHDLRVIAWYAHKENYHQVKAEYEEDWLDSGHWSIYAAALRGRVDSFGAPLYHWSDFGRCLDFHAWRCNRCLCVFSCQARQGVKDA